MEIVPEKKYFGKKEIDAQPIQIRSYDMLFKEAEEALIERGLDVDSLDYHSVVSEEELNEIIADLNRSLPRQERWRKSDFIVVFIAASIGSLADIILSDRNNLITGKGSDFSEWLNQFHRHEGGGPIDYQGPNFGGGYHRGLSKGHDILRFVEAVMMFKNGRFEAIKFVDGKAIKVISSVNQYGNPYEQLPIIEAIVTYAQHMFADLFSSCSLPFPGSSFWVECDNRQLRKLAADMYQNGFNLKNIVIQSVSTIIIETVIRIYYSIQSVQDYKNKFELKEDDSNFEAIKHFIKPEHKEKLNEMLLVAHAIVTAINLGKVIIKKSPWELNVTEIISVIRYGVEVWKRTAERNSEYAILIGSAEEIREKWEQLADEVLYNEMDAIHSMDEVLVI